MQRGSPTDTNRPSGDGAGSRGGGLKLVSQLAAVWLVAWKNIRARWPRALVALVAVTLGVALVAAVTTGYASARETIKDWNFSWVGYSHVHVEATPAQLWDNPRLPMRLAERVAQFDGVVRVVTRQKEQLSVPTDQFPPAGEGEPPHPPETIYGYGITPSEWKLVRPAGVRLAEGRLLNDTASGEVLIEEHLAEMLGKKPGDDVNLVAVTRPRTFRIVGVLSRPRLSSISSQNVFVLRDLVIMSKADMEALHEERPVAEGEDRVALESIDLVLNDPTSEQMLRVSGEVDALREFPFGELETLRRAILVYQRQPDETRLAAVRSAGEALWQQPKADFPKLRDALDKALANPSRFIFYPVLMEVAAASGSPAADLARAAGTTMVSTADEQLKRLDRNLRMFRVASNMVSVVALLTAAYLIFTTLGMGMVQRQAELGMMRCVGAGRLQIAVATVAEAVPIAFIGTAAGLASGVLAAKWVISHYSSFFTQVVVSQSGLMWAAFGGLISVALAVALPTWLASRVSPLAASRPQVRTTPLRLDVLVGLFGLLLIALSFLTRSALIPEPMMRAYIYLRIGVPMLFLGYFLVAPLTVATAGWLLKYPASLLTRTRPRLLHDQMQTGRWRTAATFCALMVCVSMLVNLRVHSKSIMEGWQLPLEMPPGMFYFFDPLDRYELQRVQSFPEIDGNRAMPIMAKWVRLHGPDMPPDENPEGRLLAGPIGRFSRLIDLKFIEKPDGMSDQDVIARVERGGAFIATREFAARHDVHVGDKLRFWRHHEHKGIDIEIVGVVESPTMDMAIDFLNVRDRFRTMSAGTVLGRAADANRLLAEEAGLAEFNENEPDAGVPLFTDLLMFDFAPAALAQAGGGDPENPNIEAQNRLLEMIGERIKGLEAAKQIWAEAKLTIRAHLSAAAGYVNRSVPPPTPGNFASARAELADARNLLESSRKAARPGEWAKIQAAIAAAADAVDQRESATQPAELVRVDLGAPLSSPESKIRYWGGSLRQLTDMIVGEFRSTVSILQKIALWATALAALGVGFAMAANVHSRRRQLAILRAVGMTRFQLTRMVLAEAVTIALIGCFLGILHGYNLALNASYFDYEVFGFRTHISIEGTSILLAIAFSVVCCLTASLLPALRAGRTNILAALRQV